MGISVLSPCTLYVESRDGSCRRSKEWQMYIISVSSVSGSEPGVEEEEDRLYPHSSPELRSGTGCLVSGLGKRDSEVSGGQNTWLWETVSHFA